MLALLAMVVRRFEPRPTADLDAERALVERAQAGDRAALGALLGKHGPSLFRAVLLPRLGSVAAAEDALSVVYERIVTRIDRFAWQDRGIYPWMRVVAQNVALDALRARRRESLYSPDDLEDELDRDERAPPALGPDALVAEAHDLDAAKRKLEAGLEKLNPRYKLAIVRRVLEERPREEVARELSVTVATFDVILHRAMTGLRRELGLSETDDGHG